jgi:hypothetical protein
MKKVILILIGIFLVFLLNYVSAATNVTECREINESGVYLLQNNIIDSENTTCINITASNIVFNGQGHTIDGVGSGGTTGIFADNPGALLGNITLKNVTVTEWHYGVKFGENPAIGVENSTIVNVTLNSNKRGVVLENTCAHVNVTRNILYNNSAAIYILNSNNNLFRDNYINYSRIEDAVFGQGIVVYPNADDNIFINNTILESETDDIYISSADNNIFYNTTLSSAIISFTYLGDIRLIGITEMPTDPEGYYNISKYINATNLSEGWLFLNISYSHPDLRNLTESALFIARFSDSWETNTSAFSSSYGVNTASNYVYANITGFGSTFVPLTYDGTPPNITLNMPVTSANLSSVNVTFNCSATDISGLSNITLYVLYSNGTQFVTNESDISGTSNSSNFSNRLVENKEYKWNCYSCDSLGNCNSSSNKTFIVDTSNPTVKLVSPRNNVEVTSTSVTFKFNVTDDFDIKNCSLYIDDESEDDDPNQTKYNVDTGRNISFSSVKLSGSTSGRDHTWHVTCFDYSGHSDKPDDWTVTVTTNPSNDNGNNNNNDENETVCTNDHKRCLGDLLENCLDNSWQHLENCTYGCNSTSLTCKPTPTWVLNADNFSSLGNKTYNLSEDDVINFTFIEVFHTLLIKDITGNSTTFEIKSNPVNATLYIGETGTFDLNENNKTDFSVTLLGISDQKANLLLKTIQEQTNNEAPEVPEVKKPLFNFSSISIDWGRAWPFLAILVIAVVAFIVGMIIEKRRLKEGYWKKNRKIR